MFFSGEAIMNMRQERNSLTVNITKISSGMQSYLVGF